MKLWFMEQSYGKTFEDFIIDRETGRKNTLLRKLEVKSFDILSKYLFIPTSVNYLVWYLRDSEGEIKFPEDFRYLDDRSRIYLEYIRKFIHKEN